MKTKSSHLNAITGACMMIACFFLSLTLTLFTGCERPCEETGTCKSPVDQKPTVNVNIFQFNQLDKDGDRFLVVSNLEEACAELEKYGTEFVVECEELKTYGTTISSLGYDDCDDNDPLTYPGAPEIVDGKDNNCDGQPGPGECLNGSSCDDADACTTDDVCVGGICVGTEITCDDSNVCNGTETCDPISGCQAGTPLDCNDSDACTTDSCDPVQGCQYAPVSCDDLNACTNDSCEPLTGCVNSPIICDDANICNGTETCDPIAGCQAGTPLNCDDSNACTTDSCDPILGCQHVNNIVECDDGDACTTGDQCKDGVCESGPLIDCDDLNICTDDGCDPILGCQHVNNILPCDDYNACTTNDICASGACIGGPAPNCDDSNLCNGTETCDPIAGCQAGIPLNCDDSNACTTDSCDPILGCQNTPISCDDSNACTADSCEPLTGCVNSPINCDDSNLCNGTETCDPISGCQAGTPLDCNDSNVCTNDSCDPILGCQYTPITCNDNDDCTADSCNPATGCVFEPIPLCCLDDADCAGSVPVFVPPFVLQPGGYWNNGTYSYGCLPNLDPEISTGICTVCEDDDNDGWCNSIEKKCADDMDGDWDGETDCDDGDCESNPVCFACDIGNPCPQGYYCVDGQCTEFIDQHESTPAGQGGAGGGPFPDGTPDNWDDDGDGYCGVAPCLGSANPTIPVGNLLGGDCDDDPLDGETFTIYPGQGSFVTDGSYYNHPTAFEWPDNYDNDCDGIIDG